MKSFLRFSSVLSASSVKRFIFLFFTLFALSIPTWGANITAGAKIYLDISGHAKMQESVKDGKKLQVMAGHSTYSICYEMKQEGTCSNLYVVTMPKWDGCTQLAFITADAIWGGEGNGSSSSPQNRSQWGLTSSGYVGSASISTMGSTAKHLYKTTATGSNATGTLTRVSESFSTTSYKVTTSATNGSITVKNACGTAITSGSSVTYSTIIQVSTEAAAGYELESVKIGSTTYTADQFTPGQEYTVTAATTISATFKATSCTEAPTVTNGTTSPTSTETNITAYGKVTALGTNCTLSETGVKLYSDANCTTEVATISSSPTSSLNTEYSVEFTDLSPSTKYYAKAYAITTSGITGNASDAIEIRTADPCLATGKTIYLKPNDNWKQAGAYFAAYFFIGDSNTWVKLTPVATDPTVYECIVPEGGYNTLIFTRMNPDKEGLNWDNKWAQTADLSGNCDANLFTIPNGDWEGSADAGNWTQYTPPVCDETNPCIVPGSTFYLQPNANWKADGARFAAYFFNNCENTWVSLTDANKDGIYECTVPEGKWMNLIFCRMNGTKAENNWDNAWNQTANLNASCGYDLFVMPETVWNGADDSNWTYQIPDVQGAYIAATRNITTVCTNDLSRFASLYVHQTGEEDAENEGYEVDAYQWKYSTNGTSWSNYTPDAATEYGVKGKNNNIRTYQTGYYRCDITLSNGSDTKVLQSNVIELTQAANCGASITDKGDDFPVFYITTTQNFPTCSKDYNSQCGEDMKAKRTVDVKMYNKGALCYDRKARMNIRGSSSLNFDKKSYAFVGGKADAKVGGDVKTDKLGFFGLPEHKDWVLYAAYADASMLRNVMAMKAYATMTGMWSCHTQHVKVYMDGKFAGVYVFMEKPTYGKGRVMVDENNGYLFGFDKTSVDDRFESQDNSIDAKKSTFLSMYSGRNDIESYGTQFDQRFEIEYPEREKVAFDDDENLVNEQAWTDKVNKLKARINEFEEALSTKAYGQVRTLIDYQTWADWFILNEFCKNLDGFRASNWFIIENEGATIKASPIWDFELSFANKASQSTMGESPDGWLHEHEDMHTDGFPIPFWFNGIGATNANTGDKDGGWTINQSVDFGGLLKDPCFKQMLKDRWAIHTAANGGITELIEWVTTESNIDNMADLLDLEEERWPAASRSKNANGKENGYDPQSNWETQVSEIQAYVQERKNKMDALIEGLTVGYRQTLVKDAKPSDWKTLTPANEDGVDVYTFDEGREKITFVTYMKETNDPDGKDLAGGMQAADMWKFYASTEDLTAEQLDALDASVWKLFAKSNTPELPALGQAECGYYFVEGALCATNMKSQYIRIKVTPTCEQGDCTNNYYRIKLTDTQTGNVIYTPSIKGVDGTATSVITIPCQGEFDCVVETKKGAVYWTEIEGSKYFLSSAESRGATTLKVELLNCTSTGATDAVKVRFTEQTEGVTSYYQIAFYYGGELLAGINSLDGETGITNGQNKVLEGLHFPVGTTYVIYRRDNNKAYDALYSCLVGQNYVADTYTGLNSNQSVTATFSVSEIGELNVSYEVVTQEPNYWISTPFAGHTGFEGGEQNKQHKSDGKDNNTMFAVECQGVQGGAQGDFYLYKYMEKKPSWSGNLAQAGVKDGNNDNVEVATNADEYGFHGGDDMHSVWVRWLFDSSQGALHVHHVHNLHLECKNFDNTITRVAPTTSDAATGMLTFEVADLTNVASYRIVADHPHGNGAFEVQPWGADYHKVVTNIGSATFTYNYAQNCMTVVYSDIVSLTIPCQQAGVSINAEGKVEVIVANMGTLEAIEGSYTVVVTNHTTKLTMRGTGEDNVGKLLPAGEQEVFTSTEKITGSYYITASLYYGTTLLNTCSLQDLNCEYTVIDTVRYVVDANLGLEYQDPCSLTFGSLENALKHLKGTPKFVKGGSLIYPVVMEVAYSKTTYQGTRKAGVSGGGTESENAMALIIENFNQIDATHPLIIRAANPKSAPWVQHVIVRNSRNITLDGLFFVSDVTGAVKDDALEFDVNSMSWELIELGAVKDANIVVKNSTIGSSGFTGLHASGYDGITFINNNFEAVFDGSDANSATWGASAKFIRCKNIQFLRNNFRGDHATLVWLQECTDALFMNNVFWNTNQYQGRCAAIRLISQFGMPVSNMAFYYNTLFLADSEVNNYKYDFLRFGQQDPSVGSYPDRYTNIEFMYNNAYSYDTDIAGRNSNAEAFYGIDVTTTYPNFCKNNFWSEYDEKVASPQSVFSFGCEGQDMINVRDQLCTTTATGPASLIVRGEDLNIGFRPTTNLASQLGANNGHDHDRYNAKRPAEGKEWTLGAYQMGEEKETDVIIWQGVASSDWDDRNNWIDKEGRRLNCLNLLSTELTAIIPAEFSHQYTTPAEGIRNWPKIPQKFDTGRTNMNYGEHVSAGLGMAKEESEITQYVKHIVMEYGAAIEGVERLVENAGEKEEVRRYDDVVYGFDVEREQWVLVGTVVKKADPEAEDGSGYRDVVSGDYYIHSHEPHVYMHKAYINDEGQADWGSPFPDLTIPVPSNEVFAIKVADQYGPNKLPAKRYYRKGTEEQQASGSKPWSYTFDGRFVNESAMPSYTGLNVGEPVLLNNSYPMNISAQAVEDKWGSVLLYDYVNKSFGNIVGDAVIKPQHGFVIEPNASAISFTPDMLVGGDTKSRSTEEQSPLYVLKLSKANSTAGEASTLHIAYNEYKDMTAPAMLDTRKVWSYNIGTPDVYAIMHDADYQRLFVNGSVTTIPLGIKLQEDMPVAFSKVQSEGFVQMILVDMLTGKEYNLLGNDKIVTEELAAGVIEGRFYLNIEIEGEVVDDEVITDVEEDAAASIQIYTSDDNEICVITDGTDLQTIYVSSMAGRTQAYEVSGNYARLRLPVAQGVYLVQAIAENATRSEKVVLK